MGAWGTGIFSDDLACDVRDEYRDLLGDGNSGSDATDILLQNWQSELDDPDAAPVFWLALAAAQWRCGRLEDRVREQAERMMKEDLARWQEDPASLKQRQKALDKLRRQLESPQPPPTKIKKTYKSTCDWEVGDILTYRLRSGKLMLFRVVEIHRDRGGLSPAVEFLDWVGEEAPPAGKLPGLGLMRSKTGRSLEDLKELGFDESKLPDLKRQGILEESDTLEDLLNPKPQFLLLRRKEQELPLDRIKRLGMKIPPVRQPRPQGVVFFKDLDERLEEVFKLT